MISYKVDKNDKDDDKTEAEKRNNLNVCERNREISEVLNFICFFILMVM